MTEDLTPAIFSLIAPRTKLILRLVRGAIRDFL